MQIPLYLRVLTARSWQTRCWLQSCTWFLLIYFLYFGWTENVIQMTDENSRILRSLGDFLSVMLINIAFSNSNKVKGVPCPRVSLLQIWSQRGTSRQKLLEGSGRVGDFTTGASIGILLYWHWMSIYCILWYIDHRTEKIFCKTTNAHQR